MVDINKNSLTPTIYDDSPDLDRDPAVPLHPRRHGRSVERHPGVLSGLAELGPVSKILMVLAVGGTAVALYKDSEISRGVVNHFHSLKQLYGGEQLPKKVRVHDAGPNHNETRTVTWGENN